MRHRKASAIYGIVDQRVRISRETLIVGLLVLVAIWLVWSFAQEVILSRDLGHQAADLRQQNTALQTENRGYQRDIAASTSGAAAEEEARGDGFSKPKEKLYMIGASPARTPARAPAAQPPAKAKSRPARPASHGGGPSGVLRALDWLLHTVLP